MLMLQTTPKMVVIVVVLVFNCDGNDRLVMVTLNGRVLAPLLLALAVCTIHWYLVCLDFVVLLLTNADACRIATHTAAKDSTNSTNSKHCL